MKVKEFGLDISGQSILVEKHRASPVVSHGEPIREELVVNILNRFLQSESVSVPCKLLLDIVLFSKSKSWIPVGDPQPFCTDERSGTLLSK